MRKELEGFMDELDGLCWCPEESPGFTEESSLWSVYGALKFVEQRLQHILDEA